MSQISLYKKRVKYCSVPAQCRGTSPTRVDLVRHALTVGRSGPRRSAGLRRNVLVDVAWQRLLLRNIAEQFFQVRELDPMPRYCFMFVACPFDMPRLLDQLEPRLPDPCFV